MTERKITPITDAELADFVWDVRFEDWIGEGFNVVMGCLSCGETASSSDQITHLLTCHSRMIPCAKSRIDADREKIAALTKQDLRHFALAADAQAEVITLREKIATLETRIKDKSRQTERLMNGEVEAELREKIKALETERENRKKSIPALPSGIEQAQYIVAHADEYIDLAVHLASWALELHAQIGELHAGFGRTESAETARLREKIAALEAEAKYQKGRAEDAHCRRFTETEIENAKMSKALEHIVAASVDCGTDFV